MLTITFFSSSSIISKIIGWLIGGNVSHCAIGFEKDNIKYFLHAAWGGVQITPRDEFLKEDYIVSEFEILINMQDEVILAEKSVGEPYDTIGLLGYIPVLLAKKFGIGIHNPLASKCAVVCSEFVVECDVNHEIKEFDGLDPANVTPKDLLDICTNGKSFKII